MFDYLSVILPVIVFLAFLLFQSIKILREYERGVVFQLGRFWKVKGPGLIILIPGIQTMERVDLRTIAMDVPEQDLISRDNVSVRVNAVLYFRVIDPQKAIINVEQYLEANAWQIERIKEGVAAARDGRTLPADDVFSAIATKHDWSR